MPSHFAAAGRAVHPGPASTCPACTRRTTATPRPSRQARGYTAEYDRNRATLISTALQASDAGQPIPCHRCQQPCHRGQALTADHVQALRHGGTSHLANLAPAHAACNYGWRRA